MDAQSTKDARPSQEKSIQQEQSENRTVNNFAGVERPLKAHNILKEDITSWPSGQTRAGASAQQEGVEAEPPVVEGADDSTPVEEPSSSAVQKEAEITREENDRLRKAYSDLTRREKEIRKREQEMNERLAKLEEKYKSYDEADDPIKALQAKGYTYEDAAKAIIHQKEENLKKDPYVEQLEQKLASVEEKLQSFEQSNQDKEAQRQVDQFREKITNHIESSGSKYELVKNYQMQDAVFETIVKTHEEQGKRLSLDEAANLVETELEKSLKSQFETLKTLDKTKNWFGGESTSHQNDLKDNYSESSETPAARAVQEAKDAQDQSQGSQKTLTNKMQSPEEMNLKKKRLSREESVALAADQLVWE